MHLLVDLDGTLTDPFPGITKCIQYALQALDQPFPSAPDLRWCIGPPLRQSFIALLGSGKGHLADAALAKYRERFSAVGLFENAVYPEIEPMLGELNRRGHVLIVATSKPAIYARRIIDDFGLKKFFRSVEGSELDGARIDKADLIAWIMEQGAITPDEVIMIGDREQDMIGARNNRVALWACSGATVRRLSWLPPGPLPASPPRKNYSK